MFLNPEQASCADMPVNVWILPANAVFLVSCWLMVMRCVEGLDVLGPMRCEPPSPIAGFMPALWPMPWPCCAKAATPDNIIASASTVICICFIGLLSSLRYTKCFHFELRWYRRPTFTPMLNETEFKSY